MKKKQQTEKMVTISVTIRPDQNADLLILGDLTGINKSKLVQQLFDKAGLKESRAKAQKRKPLL